MNGWVTVMGTNMGAEDKSEASAQRQEVDSNDNAAHPRPHFNPRL